MNKLEDVSLNDFNLFSKNSAYLYDESMIYFPYREDQFESGAIDKLFTLRYNRLFRYYYNTDGLNDSIFLSSNDQNTGVDFKSLKVYFIQNNKVNSAKIKRSKINLIHNENGIFLKRPSFDNYKSIILEIQYSFEQKSKDSIQIFLDNSKPHKEILINTTIPEIYKYKESYISNCVEKEKTQEILGPYIGYTLVPGSSKLYAYWWMERFKRENNASFIKISCKSYSTNFHIRSDCIKNNEMFPVLILLKLTSINEIK